MEKFPKAPTPFLNGTGDTRLSFARKILAPLTGMAQNGGCDWRSGIGSSPTTTWVQGREWFRIPKTQQSVPEVEL